MKDNNLHLIFVVILKLSFLFRNKLSMDVTNVINFVTKDEDKTKNIQKLNLELTQFECHRDVSESFHKNCYNLGCNGFAMKEINHLANLCEMRYPKELILLAIENVCQFKSICGID